MVIVITAFASTDSAIEAMKEGAYDYITKPFRVDEIRLVVEKALEKKILAVENRRLKTELRRPGVARAEALRRAQMGFIADPSYRHPGYWSPFLLIGSWL